MLSSVRNALKGVAAFFIVALLIIAFALFGVPELSNFSQRAPIRVGDQGVSARQILQQFNTAVRNQRLQGGAQFTRQDAIAAGLPQQIVTSLSTRSLIEQEADKLGLAMPIDLVQKILSQDERFQNPTTGEFDQEVLGQILQQYEMTPAGFKEEISGDLRRQQLVQALGSNGTLAQPFVDAIMLRALEKRDIAYVRVDETMAGIPEEPSPEKLKSYYDNHQEQFTAPEYRRFTLISLRNDDFKEGLSAPEDQLKTLYEARKASYYEQPERRTIYQLTLQQEAAAKAAVARLRDGTLFEEIAKENGTEIEAVTFADITADGLIDPAVRAAAFSAALQEGATADAIKGTFGWTVLQVAVITPAQTTTYEEVRDELETQFLATDVEKRIYETIDAIEDARDNGTPLIDAAKDLDVSVTEIGPVDSFSFAPGGAIISDISAEALSLAFTLEEGDESDAQKFDDETGWYYLVSQEITPPTLKAFETVAAEVEVAWRKEEKQRRIARAAQQIRAALDEGASLEDAAKPFEAPVSTDTVGRGAVTDDIGAELMEQIFSAAKDSVVSGPGAQEGISVVAKVNNIDFDRGQINPIIEGQVRSRYGEQLDAELLEAYLQMLNTDYNVRIDQAQIDRLFSDSQ